MAINKVEYAGETLIDLTGDTVTSETLAEGVTAHDKSGALITGTMKSGDSPVIEKDVNFYDYDGTLLYSYTLDEIQSLSELPTPKSPDSDYLVFQEWNWSLDELKELNDVMDVGANYQTVDGCTKLFLTIDDEELLTVSIYFPYKQTIDWGDGTITENPNTTLATHTYNELGDYVISCTGLTSGMRFSVGDAIGNLAVRKAYIGNNIDQISFHKCANLKSISLPNSGKTKLLMYEDVFTATNITFLAIPKQNASMGYRSAREVIWKNISFPKTFTRFDSYSFYNNGSGPLITRLILPPNLNIMNTYSLFGFNRLQKITIPKTVTTMGNYTLNTCGLLREIHMKPTTPPTLGGANALANGYANRVIYVPQGSLEAYQTATNWSTYASQMREEE